MRSAAGDAIRNSPVDRSTTSLAVVAAVVVLADLVTKQIAVARLGAGAGLTLGDAIRLALFHNHGLAWGLSGGGQALAITLVGTALLFVAVGMVRRPLAVVDPSSPRMLGLIVGAAIGNAASLFLWPAGAPDFIALATGSGSEVVINVADVALFVGIALCCRTTWRIAAAVQVEREHRTALTRSAQLGQRIATGVELPHATPARERPRRPLEREIPLVAARDDDRRQPEVGQSRSRPRPTVADRATPRPDDRRDEPRPTT